MTKKHAQQMDAIMRVLYNGKHVRCWKDVYKEANIPKHEADFAFGNLRGDGVLKPYAKGDGSEDSHHVTITEKGIAFFMRNSYLSELQDRKNTHKENQRINIQASEASVININESFNAVDKQSKETFFQKHIGKILTVLAGLIALITAYLKS